MILVGNFMKKVRVVGFFTRNKHQISRLLDYHNLDPRLYNLDHKLTCLATIQII
jgi:hypothetical protein